MAEARLGIRPQMVGNGYQKGIASLSQKASSFNRLQDRAMSRQMRDARKLENVYNGTGRAIQRMGSGLSGVSRRLLSIKSLVGGVLLGSAGKSFIEATIGSAAEVRKSESVLKALIKDQDKFLKAQIAGKDLVKEVSSLSYSDALSGLEKTFVLSGNNIGQAKQLVKVAKALENLAPEQGFEGALFALKELEAGDTKSLRSRFNLALPNRNEAKKLAKKAGKELNTFYFDEVTRFIDKRYGDEQAKGSGVEELLRIDRESLPGKIKMLKTGFADFFRTVGEDAETAASEGIGNLKKSLDELQGDPQFKEDVKDFAKFFAEATRDGLKLAAKLPAGIKSARKFAAEYKTELKIALGLFAANKLSGGMLTRGAGSLLSKGAGAVGRGIFGKAGSALGSVGAQPVYVTNFNEMGGSGESFLGRNASKFSAGSGGLVGKVGLAGAGATVAAGGLILGSAALGAATFYKAVNDTNTVVKKYEQRAKEAAERARKSEDIRRMGLKADIVAQSKLSIVDKQRAFVAKEAKGLGTVAGLGRASVLKKGIGDLFGGGNTVFQGNDEQNFALAQLNKSMASAGLKLDLKKGQAVNDAQLQGGLGIIGQNNPEIKRNLMALQKSNSPQFEETATALARQGAQAKSTASQFNKVTDKMEFHFHGVVDGEDAANRAGKALQQKMKGIFVDHALKTGS